MANKNKKRLSRRAQERRSRLLKKFDLVMLGIGLNIVIAGFICLCGDTSLKAGGAASFSYWCLMVYSYIPMGVVAAVKSICSEPFVSGVYASNLLAAVGFIWFLLLWLSVRTIACITNRMNILHVAFRIATVLLIWGWFQVICSAVVFTWRDSGFGTYHTTLGVPASPSGAETQSAPSLNK